MVHVAAFYLAFLIQMQHNTFQTKQKKRRHLSILLKRMKSPKHKYRKNIEYIHILDMIKFSLFFFFFSRKSPMADHCFHPFENPFSNKCLSLFAVLSVAWMNLKHCFWRHWTWGKPVSGRIRWRFGIKHPPSAVPHLDLKSTHSRVSEKGCKWGCMG